MKKILSILAVSILLISGSVYASFPVKNNETIQSTQVESSSTIKDDVEKSINKKEFKKEIKKITEKSNSEKESGMDTELIITLLLLIFLGGFAAHRWYRGKPTGWNILFILTAGGCGIWMLVDLVNILTGKF